MHNNTIVDWPKWMGFDVDNIKEITKENPLSNKWDRIDAIKSNDINKLNNIVGKIGIDNVSSIEFKDIRGIYI